MNIYELLESGVRVTDVSMEFVDTYLVRGSSINEALRIFVGFLITLSTKCEATLNKYDFILIENLNVKEKFQDFGPEEAEALLEYQCYDEFVIAMLSNMKTKCDMHLNLRFIKKIQLLFKNIQCCEMKGMLDLSTYLCTSFIRGIFDNFCVSNISSDQNESWVNLCGEYVALTYSGLVSPYFGLNALEQICRIHEKSLDIFKCDPGFFIKFIKGLQIKVVRMGYRTLRCIENILNSCLDPDDKNIFETELLENFDYIYAMFIQNKSPKLEKQFLALLTQLNHKVKYTEDQKLALIKRVYEIEEYEELGLFLVQVIESETANDIKKLFYILSVIKENTSEQNIKLIRILWKHWPFIRNLDLLLVYFIKIQNADQLCNLAKIIVAIAHILRNDDENIEEFENLLKVYPAVVKKQKEISNFNVVNILLDVIIDIDLKLCFFRSEENISFYETLTLEIIDVCKQIEFFDNTTDDELIVKKLFDVLDNFFSIDSSKNLVCDFLNDLFKEFYLIIDDIKQNEADIDKYKQFSMVNIKVSEAILHNFGLEYIDLEKLIDLYFKELKHEGVFETASLKYNQTISGSAIKSFSDCICLLNKGIEINQLNKESLSITFTLCISLIEFIILENNQEKDEDFVVKSIYCLVKLIQILYQLKDKLKIDEHQLIWYYENTMQLILQFTFNDPMASAEAPQNKAKKTLTLRLLAELNSNYIPDSTILWKFLKLTGKDHAFNNELKSIIDHLLVKFKSNFVQIFIDLLFNIDSKQDADMKAFQNIQKLYQEKFPLKIGLLLSETFLHIEGSTILTLIQNIHKKLEWKYGPNNENLNYAQDNLLECLDFIEESFLKYFQHSPTDQKTLFEQLSLLYTKYFHLLNSIEKPSLKAFIKKTKMPG